MIYKTILNKRLKGDKGIAVLLDPDNYPEQKLIELFNFIKTENCKVDLILVGGSLLLHADFEKFVTFVKGQTSIPVIIFPGSNKQISKYADAILFLSLISGRNAEYLIGQQVEAAPLIKKIDLETISTGYILIEGGKQSTTALVSNTVPIPSDNYSLAANTALAGEMMGMKIIYLEAGSGALKAVNKKIIQNVKDCISVPLIVGGGIVNENIAKEIFEAGADFIVLGNVLEKDFTVLKRISNLLQNLSL